MTDGGCSIAGIRWVQESSPATRLGQREVGRRAIGSGVRVFFGDGSRGSADLVRTVNGRLPRQSGMSSKDVDGQDDEGEGATNLGGTTGALKTGGGEYTTLQGGQHL